MALVDFREILQYIPKFTGKIIIFVIDGNHLKQKFLRNLLMDLAVLQSLNIKPILIFGAGDFFSNKQKIIPEDIKKIKIKSAENLNLILREVSCIGRRACHCNAILANPFGIINGNDSGLRGKINKIDSELIFTLLEDKVLPLFQPILHSSYQLDLFAEISHVAQELAYSLKAIKLIFFREKNFSLKFFKKEQISAADAQTILQKKFTKISHEEGSFLSMVNAAVQACKSGLARAHFLDSEKYDSVLTELFSNKGIGFMIHSDLYEQIRPAKENDIAQMLELMQSSFDANEILKREDEQIRKNLNDFFVLQIDQNIIATLAIHFFKKEKIAELACLFVRKEHKNEGFGTKLATFACQHAKKLGCKKIFALTTQASAFFNGKLLFKKTDANFLPPKRREKLLESKRKSDIFVKKL